MDSTWATPIDIYCERIDPGFWAEPVNAITNAAFLIAAAASFIHWRKNTSSDWPALFLIGVLTVIGIGSFLFHTFANRWSVLADVIPITIFIYAYFLFAMRRFFGLGILVALATTIAFLAVSFGFDAALPDGFLNGSGSYLPALFAILIIGAWMLVRQPVTGRLVLLAGCIFIVSLAARSIDMAICPDFPLGTHFIWHTLNAVTLYVMLSAMMAAAASCGPKVAAD